jgi:hypothetical protein
MTIMTHITACAEAKHAIASSKQRVDALNAQIKQIQNTIKDETAAMATSSMALELEMQKIITAGIREDDAIDLVNQQTAVMAALDEARSNATRLKTSRPKAEKQMLGAARKQGYEAGEDARSSGSIETVINPWASGSAEADAFVEGLHEGFAAAEDTVLTGSKSTAQDGQGDAYDIDEDINIGLAEAAHMEKAGTATDMPAETSEDDPFSDPVDEGSQKVGDKITVTVSAGRLKASDDEPF